MRDLQALKEAVLKGDTKPSRSLTGEALQAGVELLLAARAMKASLALIRPILAQRGTEPIGRAVVGTVKGDLHDVGKNLVASLLEGGGFEVIDLGENTPTAVALARKCIGVTAN